MPLMDQLALMVQALKAPAKDPNDLTNSYNTELSPEDEEKYQAWAKTLGQAGNTYDYDLRGAYAAGQGPNGNGHFTDQFKKPNHPTFSDQSQYATDVNATPPGHWSTALDGNWNFQPSAQMMQQRSPEEMQAYWNRVEPNNHLVLPIQ